jgi:hypothetical protein
MKEEDSYLELVTVVLVLPVEGRVRINPIDGLDVLSNERQNLFFGFKIIFFLGNKNFR